MKRTGVLAPLALFASLASCAHFGHVEIGDLTNDANSDIHTQAGQKIDGYTKTDQVYYQYHGWVRLDGPDSLRFSTVKFELEGTTQDPAPPGNDRFTLPVSEVKSFNLD
jgi:hypothetical protein